MNSIIMKNLSGITAPSIEKYLTFTGWTRDLSFKNPRLMVFNNNEEKSFRIAVPADEKSRDFYERVYDIVLLLSDYQNDSVENIIQSIKSAYTDRIQIRIITDATEKGKIPLPYAVQCIEGLKDLVLYAACAEENAQPVCLRALNAAKNRLDKFQFAQTEIGSFIFNVDVPVIEEENEQGRLEGFEFEVPDPPEHKIVKRIQTAISQVDSVVKKSRRLSDIIATAYQDGITANMCDALSKLCPEEVADISIETTFRYAEAITQSVAEPIKSVIGQEHFAFYKEISKRYKDTTEIIDISLRGAIKTLSKDDVAEGMAAEDTVKIVAMVDKRMHFIKMHLTPENHEKACDAYRDDKEVLVEGTLDKSQKNWAFTEVRKFEVIE